MQVEEHLVGPEADVTKELVIARSWAGVSGMSSIRGFFVRDGRGEIGSTRGSDEGPDVALKLDRAPEGGHLFVRYEVASASKDAPRFALHLDRESFSGVGHTFLLLPRIDARLPVFVQVRPGALAPGVMSASSFGPGDDVEVMVTPAELAQAAYVAGRIRILEPSKDEDRLVVLGRPSFDAAAVHAKISRLHGALAELFGGATKDKLTYLVVADPSLGKGHDGALLGRSFALWMGADRPFDAKLLVAAAHELSHVWIGKAVELVSDEGQEQVWFSEGFAVHYARKIALSTRLITPEEFAEDLERTLSKEAANAPSQLSSHEASWPREQYARGAFYAANLDAALSKASQGKRSLDDVMRELVTRATADKKARLSVSVLREIVTRELGAARGEELDWVMVKNHGEVSAPDDVFGPCFFRERTKTKTYELGFDAASLTKKPAFIRGVVPGSAAERAGLKDGAIVLSSKIPSPLAGDADKPVEIVVSDAKGSRKLRYVPMSERERSRWAAKASCEAR